MDYIYHQAIAEAFRVACKNSHPAELRTSRPYLIQALTQLPNERVLELLDHMNISLLIAAPELTTTERLVRCLHLEPWLTWQDASLVDFIPYINDDALIKEMTNISMPDYLRIVSNIELSARRYERKLSPKLLTFFRVMEKSRAE